jgi:large-conductance mechanosensitive channel
MEYWVAYGIIITYYILGFVYFLVITNNKKEMKKYEDYKKNDPRDDLTRELLMEAEL